MEWTMGPFLQNICGGRVELRVQLAEIIMNRRSTKYTHTLAFALLVLEPLRLNNHAKTLHEKDATQDRQQQLLMDNDSTP